jgi:uncharacterized protein
VIYLDTSVVVPLLVRERESSRVRRRLAGFAPGELAISDWMQTEFVSALGIKVRIRDLERQTALDVASAFQSLADESLTVLTPEARDFSLASQYLERFETGLRAGDALHLAIASNHGAGKLYSLDRALVKCARDLRLEMPVLILP